MATIRGDVKKQITSEANQFGSIMQQNVIKNEFNREKATLATIKKVSPLNLQLKVQMTYTWT